MTEFINMLQDAYLNIEICDNDLQGHCSKEKQIQSKLKREYYQGVAHTLESVLNIYEDEKRQQKQRTSKIQIDELQNSVKNLKLNLN